VPGIARTPVFFASTLLTNLPAAPLQPKLDQLPDRIESTICKFALSFRRDFVPAISLNEPAGSDQLSRMVQPAKAVIAARMEKAVVAGDQMPI
jgi:hypothetical protein